MPVDASILLGIRPIAQAALQSPDEAEKQQLDLEQRRMTVEDARARRQATIEAAKDNAEINAELQGALAQDGHPDTDLALTRLWTKNPRAAGKLQGAIMGIRKENVATDKTEYEGKKILTDLTGQLLQGAQDDTPENWANIHYPMLQRLNPPVADMFGPKVDDSFKDRVKAFSDAALSAKDFQEQRNKARDQILDGKPQKALAEELLAYGPNLTPDIVAEVARTHRDRYNSPSSVIAPVMEQAQQDKAPGMPTFTKFLQHMAIGEAKTQELAAQKTAHDDLVASKAVDDARAERGQAATIANEALNRAQSERHFQATQSRLNQAAEPVKPLDTKDPGFKVAQDLAYGKLPFSAFRTIEAYNRNAGRKEQIYATAAQLNPNFNPAAFEMGLTLAKNPKFQQQLASLDNVEKGVPDLLKFSDLASRSGVTLLNKAIIPGGVAIGDKKYSNFRTARIAFADELSGALGYGSATDMSREMGFNMTNEALSPDAFRDALQTVVIPFVQRKRATMLHQLGVYGTADFNPAANTPTASAPSGGTTKQLRFGTNTPFQVTKQPDGTWKSDSGAIYDDSGKRIR